MRQATEMSREELDSTLQLYETIEIIRSLTAREAARKHEILWEISRRERELNQRQPGPQMRSSAR